MDNKKMIKWTTKELLEVLEKECNYMEIRELYKALLAREILSDIKEYTDEYDKKLDIALEKNYYHNDNIPTFINEDLIDLITSELN